MRKLRILAGYRQNEFARLLDVDPSYVSRLERGLREPSLDLLRKAAEVLGLPPGVLMAIAIWTDLPTDERSRYQRIVTEMLELTGLFQPMLKLDDTGGDDARTTRVERG